MVGERVNDVDERARRDQRQSAALVVVGEAAERLGPDRDLRVESIRALRVERLLAAG